MPFTSTPGRLTFTIGQDERKCIDLSNDTSTWAMYRILTDEPKRFVVQNRKGVVRPGGTISAVVSLSIRTPRKLKSLVTSRPVAPSEPLPTSENVKLTPCPEGFHIHRDWVSCDVVDPNHLSSSLLHHDVDDTANQTTTVVQKEPKRARDDSADSTAAQSPPVAPQTENDSGTMCVVCMDAPREFICVPCGHYVMCGSCQEQIITGVKKCPTCRAVLTSCMRVYM